jgi:hypothetical protein
MEKIDRQGESEKIVRSSKLGVRRKKALRAKS